MARTILNINSVLREIKSERKNKDKSDKITVNNSEYGRINFRQV